MTGCVFGNPGSWALFWIPPDHSDSDSDSDLFFSSSLTSDVPFTGEDWRFYFCFFSLNAALVRFLDTWHEMCYSVYLGAFIITPMVTRYGEFLHSSDFLDHSYAYFELQTLSR